MRASVHAEYCSTRDHWWFRARRDIFARLLDALAPLPPSATILDVGPGSGVNLPILLQRGRVTVVDTEPSSVFECLLGGADAVRGDATRQPFGDESFDLICALDVLEHLDDDCAALRECARLLKPSGWLFVSVPALPLLWGRQDVLAQHRRRYRRAELADRMQRAGLEIARLSYFNTLLFPPILAVRLMMRPFLHRLAASDKSDLSVRSPFDGLLYRAFALEARWLVRRNLSLGVSLFALARRPRR
jgi:SAM-dependent methyltransferase